LSQPFSKIVSRKKSIVSKEKNCVQILIQNPVNSKEENTLVIRPVGDVAENGQYKEKEEQNQKKQ
jgi:hypothetical protein